MSLVNDALQRAKQRTAQPPPNSNLQLRPLEPTPTEAQPFIQRFPILITLLALVAVALVITGFLRQEPEAHVSAKSPAAVIPVMKSKVIAPSPILAAALIKETETSTIVKTAAGNASPNTNLPPMIVAAPALHPGPPKLQAILFNAAKPSAMINGKTVFIGNHVGESLVASITQTSVTLVSGTQTNILNFAE